MPNVAEQRAGAGPARGRLVARLDQATAGLLCAMVVFAPWAFGVTQPWSIWTMNAAGYALGVLLLLKLRARGGTSSATKAARALLLVTALVLGYCLVSAVNAQFSYLPHELRQEPHPHMPWLPHSLDRAATWRVFWNWLALACVFWAAHDWLSGAIDAEGRRSRRRLRLLVMVLAVNGALVAFEGILQRSSGTPKLLWFQATHDNPFASAQFGPYAYRSNAAQFFNLIWPVALAVWWQRQFLRAPEQRRTRAHQWLLPCIVLLIVAPLVSLSRAGAGVTVLQMLACASVLLAVRQWPRSYWLGMALVFALSVGAAWYFNGAELLGRWKESIGDPLRGRAETYALAGKIAEDYPWFGVGPGAYSSVFQFYRTSPADYWPGQLHNDWLEYRITFGRIGCALLVLAGWLVAVRWGMSGGVRQHWIFPASIAIALGGCLVHARVDFPLQIYSIQFVFVLLAAIFFSVSRR